MRRKRPCRCRTRRISVRRARRSFSDDPSSSPQGNARAGDMRCPGVVSRGSCPPRGNARRPLDSSPPDRCWSLPRGERPSNGGTASDARPSIPAPCVNVARRSRDGALVDRPRTRRGAPPDEQRSKERAPACVPECATRSRERVGATTYRCSSGIATVGPVPLERATTATRKRNRRVGGDASDRGAPHVFTTCGSETISAEPEALSRAKSRREALGTATEASEVERSTRGAREENARSLADSSHRSAHGVVKTPSAPVSRSRARARMKRRKTLRHGPKELKRRGRHTIRWVPVTESVDEQKSAARIFRSSARNSRKALAREAIARSSQELGARQVI